MKIGRGEINTRDNNMGMLCRVCGEVMRLGDVYGDFRISNETFNFHRQCLKQWLEYSYDILAMTRGEMDMDPTGDTRRVETERNRREFREYREALIEKLTLNA